MVDTVRIRISAAAAACLRREAPQEEKLRAARGEIPLVVTEQGLVLAFLAHDPDPAVRAAAIQGVREFSPAACREIALAPDAHPRVLDLIARVHGADEVLGELLLAHPALDPTTRAFLAERRAEVPEPLPATGSPPSPPPEGTGEAALSPDLADEEPVDEEGEAYRSKFQQAQTMGVGDKIKTALTGDKEWRTLLLKDPNKLVSAAVIKNPRITDGEILTISRSAIQNDEIIRIICANREWTKHPLIRRALVENSKTPLALALRYMNSLGEKDLQTLSKSRNVSSVIATQARKMLLQKQKR